MSRAREIQRVPVESDPWTREVFPSASDQEEKGEVRIRVEKQKGVEDRRTLDEGGLGSELSEDGRESSSADGVEGVGEGGSGEGLEL